MKTITKYAANLRGFLLIVGAMLVVANGDAYLHKAMPPWFMSLIGILAAGFITWRAWLDQSASKAANGDSEPVPVAVKQEPDETLKVEDVNNEPA